MHLPEAGQGTRAGRRKHRRARGAALVEFALLAPLFFAIVFGIVDFGVAYNDWISLRQGAREGARQAVTGRVGSDTSCSIQPGSPAFPANSEVNQLVCLVKNRLGLPPGDTSVKLLIEGTYSEKRSLKVCVMAKLYSASGFYNVLLKDRVINTSVQMKTEQTVAEAKGSTSRFLQVYDEYKKAPDVTRQRMSLETMERLFGGNPVDDELQATHGAAPPPAGL